LLVFQFSALGWKIAEVFMSIKKGSFQMQEVMKGGKSPPEFTFCWEISGIKKSLNT
jgi:hypothetical protein